MNEPDYLSEKAFHENYAEKNFTKLWFRSYISAHSIVLHSVYLIISVVTALLIEIKLKFNFHQFIELITDLSLTYSSTIIGFLLVSFSILLSLSSVRNTFKYFVNSNPTYKKPLLKVILDHFVFPIGVFLLLLIMSFSVKLIIGYFGNFEIDVSIKSVLFRIFLGTYIFIILLSVSELISYFFNVYRFIVITSFTVAKEYEEEILKKIYVLHEPVDVLQQDDAKLIVEFQETRKKT